MVQLMVIMPPPPVAPKRPPKRSPKRPRKGNRDENESENPVVPGFSKWKTYTKRIDGGSMTQISTVYRPQVFRQQC
jgi:hypothetical protein